MRYYEFFQRYTICKCIWPNWYQIDAFLSQKCKMINLDGVSKAKLDPPNNLFELLIPLVKTNFVSLTQMENNCICDLQHNSKIKFRQDFKFKSSKAQEKYFVIFLEFFWVNVYWMRMTFRKTNKQIANSQTKQIK